MEWSNQSEKNKVARAFIILTLPEESATKNTLNIVEKEVSQRKKRKMLTWLNLVKADLKDKWDFKDFSTMTEKDGRI